MKAFTSHDLTLVKWTLDRNNWVSFSLANHQVIVGVHLTSKTNKNSFKKLLQSSDPNSSMKCYHSLIIPWEKRVFRRSILKCFLFTRWQEKYEVVKLYLTTIFSCWVIEGCIISCARMSLHFKQQALDWILGLCIIGVQAQ